MIAGDTTLEEAELQRNGEQSFFSKQVGRFVTRVLPAGQNQQKSSKLAP